MAASMMLVVLFVIGLIFWPLEIWLGILVAALGLCALALGSYIPAVVGFILGGLLIGLGLRRSRRCENDRMLMIESIGMHMRR